MKALILALAATTLTSLSALAANANFSSIEPNDLESAMKTPGSVFVFDANTKSTREKDGVVPGAKLLDSVTKYDVKSTLPGDKSAKLVFYCANTMCTASHDAAKRALEAGYTNVSIMAEGIQGWKKAGKKTDKLPTKS